MKVDPQVSKRIHDRAKSAAIRDLIAEHRLEYDLLRDAYLREFKKAEGYTDGRKSPYRKKRNTNDSRN